MRIELIKIELKPNSTPKNLSPLQHQYLEVLMRGYSIAEMVRFYLEQGWLVSFSELKNLLMSLYSSGSILNSDIKYYLGAVHKSDTNRMAQTAHNPGRKASLVSTEVPFLQSLDVNTRQELLRFSQRIRLPAGSCIFKENETGRDLFAVTSGACGVFRKSTSHPEFIAQLDAGAVFGEVGFFFGKPRTADIYSLTEVELIKIPWQTQWANLLNTAVAEKLQLRFWIQHALMSARFFNELPNDCLEAILRIGKVVSISNGSQLFREGEPGNRAYLIIQGHFKVQQNARTIREMSQGDFLGEIALMRSGGHRTATVEAISAGLLLEIDQHSFYKMLGENLILAAEIERLAQQRLYEDSARRSS